jgi:hypothetical protein
VGEENIEEEEFDENYWSKLTESLISIK